MVRRAKNQLPVKIAVCIAFLYGTTITTRKRGKKKKLGRGKCLVLFTPVVIQ
jgi:hypothetical protein